MRFNVVVKHRVGLQDIVDCAIYARRYDWHDGKLEPPNSRAAWMAEVRYTLHDTGQDAWTSIEDVPDEIKSDFTEAALKLFPELAPKYEQTN